MNLIIEQALLVKDEIINMRREFHMYPEISQCEQETGQRIAKYLKEMGYEVQENVGGYGVMATLKGATDGPIVALRADTDALSITEKNEEDYKSKNQGVMHACGHDAHMSMLLGAAKILRDHKDQLEGSVRFIFQPAEELSPVGGARGMIAGGALENVDAVFGLHVWPDLPHGTIGIKKGPLMAASDHFSVTIKGKSCHAGIPDDGVDAIVVGTHFVQAIQNIISRQTSPLDSAVVTVGMFHSGTRYNIVSDTCEIEGTCRTFSKSVRENIECQLGIMLESVCNMFGATGELQYDKGYDALVNDEEMMDYMEKTAIELFGKSSVTQVVHPSMAGEDFSFYLNEKPGAYVWMGVQKDGMDTYPLHNEKFNLDEDVLWRGSALLAQTALGYSKR